MIEYSYSKITKTWIQIFRQNWIGLFGPEESEFEFPNLQYTSNYKLHLDTGFVKV